jgi:small subunit ribosomal protein S3
MGQKTNPIGMRLGISTNWSSKWFATKNYALFIHEDLCIRRMFEQHLREANVAFIHIERTVKKLKIVIGCTKPGFVLGQKGKGIDYLKTIVAGIVSRDEKEIFLVIEDIKRADLSAVLVATAIAQQLKGRVSFRKVIKRSIANIMKAGAQGVRIVLKGRIAGAEIARTEWSKEGSMPLHTLRSIFDYAHQEARTAYGIIGVKVWIHRGIQEK